jgi:predicted transposase YbfD/YdcC
VRVTRWTQRGEKRGELTKEKHYYLSSLPPDAPRLAALIRGHWLVENSCHYVLDVTFGEDHCQVRDKNAAHNLCLLREMAMKVLRLHLKKGTVRSKMKRAARSQEFRDSLLAVIPAIFDT